MIFLKRLLNEPLILFILFSTGHEAINNICMSTCTAMLFFGIQKDSCPLFA